MSRENAMVTVTNIRQIKKSIETHLKSGDLELVVLPKAEYEALLDKLDNLRDIRDSIESLKEYRAGKRISFDDYDSRRKQKPI
jgi:tRNA threonylcarbamoyladenosine modification (KEOPS) complex Cgi121 subunit